MSDTRRTALGSFPAPRADPVRHVLDVTPDLLARNDDAPAPGRLLVRCGCPICRRGERFALAAGRWAIEHRHGDGWTAQPLAAAPDPSSEVQALAVLAEELAQAATG